MGSLRKKTFTKPLPKGAELFVKKGEQFAKWVDGRNKKQTAPTTTGRDGSVRIVIESGKWLAKFKNGSGVIREVATGCSDKQAAKAALAELERRAELVRAGIVTVTEDAIADQQSTPLAEHFEAYQTNMLSRGLSDSHISEVTRYLGKLADDCRFARLPDVQRAKYDRWIAGQRSQQTGARTLNCYRAAWMAFLNWCVDESRLVGNPFAGVPKADEKADRRRTRRSMTEEELNHLLFVALWRPLAEYGREKIYNAVESGQKRSNWSFTPLTFETLSDAVDRARERLSGNRELITKLERQGRERQLIYKTMVTTGLRRGELASVKLKHLDLQSDPGFLTLDAGSEKNREGNSIPLRADLVLELRQWISELAAMAQKASCETATVRFDIDAARRSRGDAGVTQSLDQQLFKVPSSILRVLNRDLAVAGIAKCDDRGRTLDVHALRHTFGTHLSMAGVPLRTAQAAMRHSSPVLTANIYTDPRLLDVHGAVEALPTFSSAAPNLESGEAVATGTDRGWNSKLPPMLPPGAVPTVHSESFPVTSGKLESLDLDSDSDAENDEQPTIKARILTEKDSGLKSGRHDLNVRPPAPKAGALPS